MPREDHLEKIKNGNDSAYDLMLSTLYQLPATMGNLDIVAKPKEIYELYCRPFSVVLGCILDPASFRPLATSFLARII